MAYSFDQIAHRLTPERIVAPVAAPAPVPVAVGYAPPIMLSPPEPQKSGPPIALIAAGVVALGVVGLVVYKKKFAKRR